MTSIRCLLAEAAVIAMPDAKWGERPLLVVAPKEGQVRARKGSRWM
jgi:acyl-CoA synthetase (AMP-forming)/AMP-acid ligase II